jgi:hypothetical protein
MNLAVINFLFFDAKTSSSFYPALKTSYVGECHPKSPHINTNNRNESVDVIYELICPYNLFNLG